MKRRGRIALLLSGLASVCGASLGMFAAPHFAHAAGTHTVCATGCNFTSIHAAINDAGTANGDTITVAAGTYVENVVVNKSVTIKGAQAGVDARTRSGAESIIDASSASAGASWGFDVTVPNVVIDGFTLTKAYDEGLTASGADNLQFINTIVTNNNSGITEDGGNNILIKHDVISNNTFGSPSAGVHGDGLYDDFGFQNLQIIENSVVGNWQALTILPYPNTMPTGSLTISGNTLAENNFLWNVTGSFDHNTVTGPSAPTEVNVGLEIGGQDSNLTADSNTFSNFSLYAVKVKTATFVPWANNQNISIINNAFNQNIGIMGNFGDSADYPVNSLGNVLDLRDLAGTNLVSGNTFNLTGMFGTGTGSASAVHAIAVMGTQAGLTISNNLIDAHGVGGAGGTGVAPTTGVLLCDATVCPEALDASASVSITGNRIYRLVYGLNNVATLNAGVLQAHNNCISGNSAYGAFAIAGNPLTADHNWWGATSGPHNAASNPSGTGNGANDNVTFAPFLTMPTSQCAGPVTTNVAGNPNPVVSGNAVTLTATTTDSMTGGFTIASAQYQVDAGAWQVMSASDSSFDQVTEALTTNLGSGLSVGSHSVCVRATDAAEITGAAACATITVNTPAPAHGLGGQSAPPAPPVTRPSPVAQSGGSPESQLPTGQLRTPPRKVVGSAAPSQNILVVLIPAMIILLAGLTAVGVVYLRRRSETQIP